MKLTRQDIEKIALLARLELSDEESETLTEQINRLMEHFQTLQELDTSGVEPTSHVIPVSNVFREDVIQPSLPVEDVLQNGPMVMENYFVAPKIVET